MVLPKHQQTTAAKEEKKEETTKAVGTVKGPVAPGPVDVRTVSSPFLCVFRFPKNGFIVAYSMSELFELPSKQCSIVVEYKWISNARSSLSPTTMRTRNVIHASGLRSFLLYMIRYQYFGGLVLGENVFRYY